MAELSTIARPYAQAIFEIAHEQGQYDKWSDALSKLAIIVKDEQFANAVGDPRLDRGAIKKLVNSLLANSDNDINHLVNVLVDNHRLSAATAISVQFEHLRHEQEGILDAVIESAFPISDAEKEILLKELEKKFGRKIRAEVTVREELIGGVKIIVGDVVIDGSVKAQIEKMTAALKH